MQTASSIIVVDLYPPGGKSVEDCNSLSLTQALLNITQHDSTSREIYLQPGQYTLEKAITIAVSGISIVGNSENAAEVIVSCNQMSDGLTFTMTNNITIANLTISGCGSKIENSSFGVITTALYIDDCNDVTISNIVIANTNGVGLFGINLRGNCVFERVVFENNMGGGSFTRSSGGAFLVFQDDDRTENVRNSIVEFSYCTFKSNAVASSDEDDVVMNGGGGLKVVISHVSYQVTLRLSSSSFYANSAKYGAGLLIAITALAYKPILYNNWPCNISIEGCLFDSNRASVGASALLVYRDEVCAIESNWFLISDCIFIDNDAVSKDHTTHGHTRPSAPQRYHG